MAKKIIVTGGAGFIGSHTVVELVSAGFESIVIDDFRNSESFILQRIEKICGVTIPSYSVDCNDLKAISAIFQAEKPDGLIHFAADKAVGESVEKPLKYYENNIGSLVTMLKACLENEVKHIVFSSSCTIYGNPEKMPVVEATSMGETLSPYGYTKQVAERICNDFTKANSDYKVVLLRYFNPIGAHPSGLIGELPIGVPNNLVPFITQTAAGIREELTIHGDDYPTADGTCIRDYIHVCDLADGHVKALEKIRKLPSGTSIFNVGTGSGNSVMEVVKGFEEANQTKVPYTIGPRREGDIVEIFAATDKISTVLNWKAKYTLKDALSHAWKWQQQL